jgi:hypothetical protein
MGFDAANLFWDDVNNRLGIGINPPLRGIDVVGRGRFDFTTPLNPAANYFGVESNLSVFINANNAFEFVGFYGFADHTSGGGNLTLNPFASGYAEAGLVGVLGFTLTEGVVTVTGTVGLACQNLVRAGCTVTNVIGALIVPFYNDSGAGITVTNAYGVYIKPSQLDFGGAVVGTQYGVFVATMLAAGTRWGVYVQDTAASNFFGGKVIATAATTSGIAGAALESEPTSTAVAGTVINWLLTPKYSPAAASNASYQAFFLQCSSTGAQNFTGSIYGLNMQALHNSSGTCTLLVGLNAVARKTTTGAVTNAVGIGSQIVNANATAQIGTGYTFKANSPNLAATGFVTTQYGVYIDDQMPAGVTTGYGVYQVGATTLNVLLGKSGFGVAASTTAWAVLAASTATLASLRITAGSAAYAGTVEGDFWNDFTQKCLIGHIDGLKQFDVRASFVGTATVTITNTNAETTMFGAGVGTLTFPANFFTVGKTIRITIRGEHTMDVTPPTITFRVKLGGVTFASAIYTDKTDTNLYFELSFILTCRTTGAGGTGIGQGVILMCETTGTSNTDTVQLVMTATAAMATTGALALDVTAHPNAADAGSSLVLTNHLVEVIA